MRQIILKITIIALIIIFFTNGSAQEYWIPSSTPTTINFRTICFIDTLNGWAAGDSGVIIHTSDGGDSWILQNSPVNSVILDIFFVSPRTGWALSWNTEPPTYNTAILKTTDGGDNWNIQKYTANLDLFRSLFFHDSLKGFIAGKDGKIEKTIDGGDTWVPVLVDSGLFSQFPIIHLNFFNSELAFAGGGSFDYAGVVWRSINGGDFWTSQVVGPEPIHMIWPFDSLNIIGVGGDFEYGTGIIRTTNGGDTWDYTNLTIFGIARAVSFRTPSEGWIVMGLANKFLLSRDSSESWNEYMLPANEGAYDVTFIDSNHGFAAGVNGLIYKYNRFLVSAPQLLAPPNGVTGIDTSVSLSWQDLDGAKTYDLQVSNHPDFSQLVIDETQLTSTTYTVTGLFTNTLYYWRVRGNNATGSSLWSTVWSFQTTTASPIGSPTTELPEHFYLSQNYPNPFNSTTHLRYAVPVFSEIQLSVIDILGKEVQVLSKTTKSPGIYTVEWEVGVNIPSGIYFVQIKARDVHNPVNNYEGIRKMILIK
jgi:photosystem II stability/assembly factor-like uncharacterized protein